MAVRTYGELMRQAKDRIPRLIERLKAAHQRAQTYGYESVDPRDIEMLAEMGDAGAREYLTQPYRFNAESPIELTLVLAIVEASDEHQIPGVHEPQRDLFVWFGGHCFRVEMQVRIGKYRADILLTGEPSGTRLVVECDGYAYHSTPEQRARDARRDAYMRSQGIEVLRFTGSRIHWDASECAAEVAAFAQGMEG